MPIKNYGVLKGKAVKTMMGSNNEPHYQVLIKDDAGTQYRIAINIKSQASPSDVLYYVGENFHSEELTTLPDLKFGFTAINPNNPSIGLDYIRGHLFNPSQMIPLPPEASGPDNDLNDKLQDYFKQAIEHGAIIYAFGQRWGPETNQPDQYFKFSPGNGIHDIHMNQGNTGGWTKDNGTWQDGGILIQFEQDKRWVAIFLAFQSQSWCTDENGNAIKPVDECDYKTVNVPK
ncbi:YukJ family protein [Pullulanibacillus sp. KACC 23026]|uniref:YukJ family protein n=1 Tax=Pullulanibacillus sp. KACC 23026 TaxID=3028315 RepID=UPI0023B0786B|nr:YukJ family protein [Pullulanibacillus sp. KACC 23026]WEG14588.1 YukJ family protein [Pullulanibacillus sp. KACC 23026]